jgi:hypothetical protein
MTHFRRYVRAFICAVCIASLLACSTVSINAPISERQAASTLKTGDATVTTNAGQKIRLRVIEVRDHQLIGMQGSQRIAIDLRDIASIERPRRFPWLPYAIAGAAVVGTAILLLLNSHCGHC